MLEYVVSILIIVFILGYLKLYYLPKRNFLWHQKVYQALGYQVKTYDFQFMSIGFNSQMQQTEKKYGDPNYMFKNQQFWKYDIILTNLATKTVVTILNVDLLKNMFTLSNIQKLPKSYMFISNIKRLLGDGIVLSQGDIWKRKRMVLNKLFSHHFIIANIPKITKYCDQVMDAIEQSLPNSKMKEAEKFQIDISRIFSQIFQKVMLKNFFGSEFKDKLIDGKQVSQFTTLLLTDLGFQTFQAIGLLLGNWVFNLGLTANHRDINRRIKLIKNLAKELIQERLEEVKKKQITDNPTDIIEALYKYKMDERKQEEDYQFDELVDEFFTFFLAGTETTQNFTKTLIYYVALDKKIENRLREEISKHITSDEDINWQNLKKLQYIDWLQHETIRCYGPANAILMRQAVEDQLISNLPLKKGDLIDYISDANHNNPNLFKNPIQFRPERWQSQCKNIPPFALVGFSTGPRSCLGKSLALIQSKIAIIKFMKRYKSIKMPCEKLKFINKFMLEPVSIRVALQKNQSN